ncbi:MAG TPA: hypothetical protein VFL41_13150 [Gaiellaceae bacterium]|nr:hypothetical protein [Gaiellaceae bacterium]
MEANVVVDRGRSGAERLVETMRQLPPMERFRLRRKSRVERLRAAVNEIGEMPVVRVALAAAGIALVACVAYAARRRLFAATAVVADVVEEAADTVEDAAEDLAEAARDRAADDAT